MSDPIKKPGRVWYYRPGSWSGLWPVFIGHDEWARRTLVLGLGWLTGVVVIAYRDCGDPECEADMRRRVAEDEEDLRVAEEAYAEWVAAGRPSHPLEDLLAELDGEN